MRVFLNVVFTELKFPFSLHPSGSHMKYLKSYFYLLKKINTILLLRWYKDNAHSTVVVSNMVLIIKFHFIVNKNLNIFG